MVYYAILWNNWVTASYFLHVWRCYLSRMCTYLSKTWELQFCAAAVEYCFSSCECCLSAVLLNSLKFCVVYQHGLSWYKTVTLFVHLRLWCSSNIGSVCYFKNLQYYWRQFCVICLVVYWVLKFIECCGVSLNNVVVLNYIIMTGSG